MKSKMKKLIIFLFIFSMTLSTLSVSALPYSEISSILNSKYSILVNREHKVDSSFSPKNLITYKNTSCKLEATCANALETMIKDCKAAGGETLVLYSGYRTYQTQYNKYYNKINYYIAQGKTKAEAQRLTDAYYAPPGASEHHTGLAADICTPSTVNRYGQLHESFGNTKEGKWLRDNSWKYGFILRYEKGKESITGYNYEPWHFRYVGKTLAKEIYNSKLTMEEYMSSLSTAGSKLSTPPTISVNHNKITFSSPKGTEIRYTENLKTPTANSTKYSSALTKKDITYKAVSCYKGHTSNVTTITVTAFGDVFRDITTKDWFYDYVSEAVNLKIFNGMGDYAFAPQSTMSRAMVVQMLANMSGVNLATYKNKSRYTDVKKNAWYAPAIEWATQNGYVDGMGDKKFAPLSPVTREQVCKILYSYSGKGQKSNHKLSFKDKVNISSWAYEGISFCVANNIVGGYPDGTFLPKATATRAEVAKIALNFHNL